MSVNEVKIKPAQFELEVTGTGHPSSRTFAIGDEDHTLGNALRHVLMKNQKVEFAGYSVPHPSEPVVQIRVQTAIPPNKKRQPLQTSEGADGSSDADDGRIPATDALKEACDTLIAQCDIVLDQVEELMPEVKQDRMDLEDSLRNEGYEEGDDEMLEEDEEDIGEDGYEDEEMM